MSAKTWQFVEWCLNEINCYLIKSLHWCPLCIMNMEARNFCSSQTKIKCCYVFYSILVLYLLNSLHVPSLFNEYGSNELMFPLIKNCFLFYFIPVLWNNALNTKLMWSDVHASSSYIGSSQAQI